MSKLSQNVVASGKTVTLWGASNLQHLVIKCTQISTSLVSPKGDNEDKTLVRKDTDSLYIFKNPSQL